MLAELVVRALLAGLGMALAAAPLGCFVAWRRMAYFGDATAHAALLGVALALALELPVGPGVLMVALAMAVMFLRLRGRGQGGDVVLGVLSHGLLAAGLVAVAALGGPRVDLMALLFGDVLTVTRADLALIWAGGAAVVGMLVWRWRRLVIVALNRDLAVASGIEPRREDLVLVIALALVVAVGLQVVGALLIGAMLLIPAAAARGLARTPEAMALGAAVIGAGAVGAGVGGAVLGDLPVGPAIVAAGFVFYLVLSALGAGKARGLR